jgi:hypothetical protein
MDSPLVVLTDYWGSEPRMNPETLPDGLRMRFLEACEVYPYECPKLVRFIPRIPEGLMDSTLALQPSALAWFRREGLRPGGYLDELSSFYEDPLHGS